MLLEYISMQLKGRPEETLKGFGGAFDRTVELGK